MANPVLSPSFPGMHLWLENSSIWGIGQFRIGGVYAPANGEFDSMPFASSAVPGLWLNADARWHEDAVAHGCDEGCAAYVMVALFAASDTAEPLAGYEQEHCLLMNVEGPRLPLRWTGGGAKAPLPAEVLVRIYFRDATIWALGSGDASVAGAIKSDDRSVTNARSRGQQDVAPGRQARVGSAGPLGVCGARRNFDLQMSWPGRPWSIAHPPPANDTQVGHSETAMIINNAQALTLCKGVDWSNGSPTISHDAITVRLLLSPMRSI